VDVRRLPTPTRRVSGRGLIKVRLFTLAIAALTSLAVFVCWAGTAAADPEGGTASLRADLDQAVRGYLDAKAALDASKARQAQLEARLATAEANFAAGQDRFAQISASAYRSSGSLSDVVVVLSSGSPRELLGRLTMLDVVASREHAVIEDLVNARQEVSDSKAALDAETAAQAEHAGAMNARKLQAEQALWAYGGGQATGGFNENSEKIAEAAPRNADGTWPGQSCSVYEAATGGCITPRAAHARGQVIAAGFNRVVSCYRSYNDGGEHPKGRACDFMIGPDADASGADRTYGNSLAAFLIYNADRLGVLYVIWYRQIWIPSSGWRAYSGCCDPSSKHTNHVHLSVY
jgi:hypothetical protein